MLQEEQLSCDAFCSDIAAAAWILKQGFDVRNGTLVALAIRVMPEMLILIMGIAATGGVVVFLHAWWNNGELEYAFRDSAAKIGFADGASSNRLMHLPLHKGLTLVSVHYGEDNLDLTYSKLLRKQSKKVGKDIATKLMKIS